MLLFTYFYVIIGHSVVTKFYNIPLNVILLYYAGFSSVYFVFFFHCSLRCRFKYISFLSLYSYNILHLRHD